MATLNNGCELQTASGIINNGGVPAAGCISKALDTQSTINSPTATIPLNPPSAVPQPLTVTKDTSGKTLTAAGQLSGTSVLFSNPA